MTRRVCIIGAGCSGTLVAIHLLRRWRGARLQLTLVDRSGHFGPGLAYGTNCPAHLLNVPAGRMSGLADDPDDFVRWARTAVGHADRAAFLPRGQYGEYLKTRLREAIATARDADVRLVTAQVCDVVAAPAGIGWPVRLPDETELRCDGVVFALGHYPPADPPLGDSSFYASPRYIPDPWVPDAVGRIDPGDNVLLLGAGLTAVDVVLELRLRGHAGVIHAISRHGLLPQVHVRELPESRPVAPDPAVGTSVRKLVRHVRAKAHEAVARGGDWQEAVDSLRAATPDLWRGLADRERSRFLRHVRPYWDVHRHRMPPSVASEIAMLLDRGQLRIHAGHVSRLAEDSGGVQVTWRPRGRKCEEKLGAAFVANCTGPLTDIVRVRDPLTARLVARGLLAADRHGLGGMPRTRATAQAYWIGPLRKAEIWESIAVPELRAQANAIAEQIAHDWGVSDSPAARPRQQKEIK